MFNILFIKLNYIFKLKTQERRLKMQTITIKNEDNVCVVVEGELSGHKIAKCDIKAGEDIIKYGNKIGHATSNIKIGEHIHTHNMKYSRLCKWNC